MFDEITEPLNMMVEKFGADQVVLVLAEWLAEQAYELEEPRKAIVQFKRAIDRHLEALEQSTT